MSNILIVDDNAAMRKIIMRGIRQAGFKVASFAEAGDGEQALEQLQRAPVDLILSDVSMPHMDGLDFVKSVRAQHGADTPIFMIAAEGNDEVIGEARREGANGCLQKPCTPEKIQEILGPHLD